MLDDEEVHEPARVLPAGRARGSGDVIPWQEDGRFHLFYLHDAAPHPEGRHALAPRRHRRSRRLPRDGHRRSPRVGRSADDFNIYTGQHRARRRWHAPRVLHRTESRPPRRPTVSRSSSCMHATSALTACTPGSGIPRDTFGATPGYETADWRDPFVFWDGECRSCGGCSSPPATSRAPRAAAESSRSARRAIFVRGSRSSRSGIRAAIVAHECPEVFRVERLVVPRLLRVQRRRSRPVTGCPASLHGPWLVPEHDTIDGRAYYAAKSAARGGSALLLRLDRLARGRHRRRRVAVGRDAVGAGGRAATPTARLRFHPPREFAADVRRSRRGRSACRYSFFALPTATPTLIAARRMLRRSFRLVARFDIAPRHHRVRPPAARERRTAMQAYVAAARTEAGAPGVRPVAASNHRGRAVADLGRRSVRGRARAARLTSRPGEHRARGDRRRRPVRRDRSTTRSCLSTRLYDRTARTTSAPSSAREQSIVTEFSVVSAPGAADEARPRVPVPLATTA